MGKSNNSGEFKRDAALLAIGVEPVAARATTTIHTGTAEMLKLPTQSHGTKQAMLIAMLHAPLARRWK